MSNDNVKIDWLLRLALVLQCVGYAYWIGVIQESPLLGWLWEPTDVGGLALGETASIPILHGVALFLAVAAVSTLLYPSRLLVAGVALFQVTMMVAEWQTRDGFPLDVSRLGTGKLREVVDVLVPMFPFAAEAARVALPLSVLLVHWSRLRKLLGIAITPTVEGIIRLGLALTFAAHGLEALQQRGAFLDMLIVAAHRLLGVALPEPIAQWMLAIIGTIDIVLAFVVLTRRSRGVAMYMAFWGLVTAAARVIVLAPHIGWYEMSIRSAHWALPLVLVLAWRLAPRADKTV